MAIEIITREDLEAFRLQLLQDLKLLLTNQQEPSGPRRWLKSAEVQALLQLSPGKLQNLRVSGRLPFARIDGTLYYRYEDVLLLLDQQLPHE
jgi:hypothetical protein